MQQGASDPRSVEEVEERVVLLGADGQPIGTEAKASVHRNAADGGTPLHLDLFGLHLPLGTFPGGVSGILLGTVVCLLIGTAAGWGGNPDKDATYLSVTPAKNDGTTVYKLNVKDVPVDAFWSISLYNAEGYFQKNDLNAYSLNNITAKKNDDGSVSVQFGGCDGKIPNCLPIMKGWNYTVRLYRPRAQILSGMWKFPEAQPVN